MRYKLIILALVLITLVGALIYWLSPHTVVAPAATQPRKENPISTAGYICNNKKTIDAAFYEGPSVATSTGTNTPPVPNGTVELILSDNRTLTLKQTISADGARFANNDETFIFWSKGNGALVTDNGDEKSYWGCVAAVPPTPELPNVYHDGHNGFTIRYAEGAKIDSTYAYRLRGPGESSPVGVKFLIPATIATGTNLSGFDTGLSVETASTSDEIAGCTAQDFANHSISATTTTINGTEYSFASTSDVGAGNFYEEHIFTIPYSQPCIAVRYFIHSTNIDNYTPGTVKEFDKAALLKEFDTIRDTLVTQ